MKPQISSLKSRFCSARSCSEADFETLALKSWFHAPWDNYVEGLRRMRPTLFKTDLAIVRRLGEVRDHQTLFAEIQDLQLDYQRNNDFGLLRRWLNFRLSGKRISAGCADLLTNPEKNARR